MSRQADFHNGLLKKMQYTTKNAVGKTSITRYVYLGTCGHYWLSFSPSRLQRIKQRAEYINQHGVVSSHFQETCPGSDKCVGCRVSAKPGKKRPACSYDVFYYTSEDGTECSLFMTDAEIHKAKLEYEQYKDKLFPKDPCFIVKMWNKFLDFFRHR